MSKTPRDLADRMAARRDRQARAPGPADGFIRETFTAPREGARQTAKEFFDRYPKQAYMTQVEHWRELPDGGIEFTMRRLPTAD